MTVSGAATHEWVEKLQPLDEAVVLSWLEQVHIQLGGPETALHEINRWAITHGLISNQVENQQLTDIAAQFTKTLNQRIEKFKNAIREYQVLDHEPSMLEVGQMAVAPWLEAVKDSILGSRTLITVPSTTVPTAT